MKNKKTSLFFVLFIAFLIGGCNVFAQFNAKSGLRFPEGKTAVEIPFEQGPNGHIIMPVQVNGSKTLKFILDTGAPVAIFPDSEAAKMIDLEIIAQAAVGGVGSGQASTVPLAGNVTFSFGGIDVTNALMAVGAGEKLPGRDWDGVFGKPVFDNLVVDIDWIKNVIRFHRPETYAYSGRGVVVPIVVKNHIYVDATVNIDGGRETKVSLAVDTGAAFALSLAPYTDENLFLPKKHISDLVIGYGANGPMHGALGRIASLKLQDFQFTNVVTTFPDREGFAPVKTFAGSQPFHGLLGARVLKRFRVILDYSRSQMILEPNQDFDDPFEANTTGMFLLPAKNGADEIKITEVVPNSPAQEAGLRAGDRLISVNGRAVSQLSAHEITALLREKPGRGMILSVKRNGERKQVKLVSRKLI